MELRLNRKPLQTVSLTQKRNAEKSTKCTYEIPSSIVSVNANTLNDADTRMSFLPVNEIWQRQMCQLFKIDFCTIKIKFLTELTPRVQLL